MQDSGVEVEVLWITGIGTEVVRGMMRFIALKTADGCDYVRHECLSLQALFVLQPVPNATALNVLFLLMRFLVSLFLSASFCCPAAGGVGLGGLRERAQTGGGMFCGHGDGLWKSRNECRS